MPLQQHAEEGVADPAGGDRPGDVVGLPVDRVQAELTHGLACPAAETVACLRNHPAHLVGESPGVVGAGDDQPGVPGEVVHGPPRGFEPGARPLVRQPPGGEVVGPADRRDRRIGRPLHAIGVIGHSPGLVGPFAGLADRRRDAGIGRGLARRPIGRRRRPLAVGPGLHGPHRPGACYHHQG
jgi:hypothetical protein